MFPKYKILLKEYVSGTTYSIYRRRWLFWYTYLGGISIDDYVSLTAIDLMLRLHGLGITDNDWIIKLSLDISRCEKAKAEDFAIVSERLDRILSERLSNG